MNNGGKNLKNLTYSDNNKNSFFHRLPYNPELTQYARRLRRTMTCAEKKIWFEILANKKLGNLRWLRQRPIDNFIVDFYCPKLKLVIEIDGKSHDEKLAHDDERTKILEKYGLKVIRFQNDYVLDNIDGVYRTLFNYLQSRIDDAFP